MAIDKEKLKKLSPEERLKQLKKLEEDNQKEIDEAEDLIKKTEAELERNMSIPDIEVPEIEPVDISKMFQPEEGLETTVTQEASKEEDTQIKYESATDYEATSLWQPPEAIKGEDIIKMEDGIKYESTAEKGDDITASRSALKKIQKYTKG